MLSNLSSKTGPHLRGAFPRLILSVAAVLIFAATASAYTLVFRGGQRIEIPDDFTLTRTTLTFEISPGFNRTILLTLIDVAATERANRESPGTFLKRREATSPAPAVVNEPAPRAVRTLTNTDLAGARQRRIESEQAYEARRKQLGLPTVAETRQRQDEESAAFRAQLRESSAARLSEERYWRDRARALRTEIAMVDTQINYVRGRINEVAQSQTTQGWITDVYPIWPRGRRGGYPNRPNGGYWPARPPYGGGLPNIFGYPGYGLPGYGYPGYGYPPGPFDNFDRSGERSDLTYRLDDLVVKRAALLVQWRTLEDEARDARVPQVWLEP
jgi:hypothetical protein